MTSPLGNTLGHLQGRFYIQEASSCLPPQALFLQPKMAVLDMAAAPGSKTTQISALMNGKGSKIRKGDDAEAFRRERERIFGKNKKDITDEPKKKSAGSKKK